MTKEEQEANKGEADLPVDPIDAVVREVTEEFDVQPVLFVAAGLSRRYIGAPDWDGALRDALALMGSEAPAYSYFVQKHGDDKARIGTAIGELLFEWAWTKGKGSFPSDLYASNDKFIFLKHAVAKQLVLATPENPVELDASYKDELEALREIRPHAVITTNYDEILEAIFDGYEPIVGKSVLRYESKFVRRGFSHTRYGPPA